MPTEVDYSKRGIWENIFDPGAWQNLLGGVGTITGGVADIFEQMEKIEGSQPLTPPPPEPPKYDPDLGWRDFVAKPNMPLVIFGCSLILVAYLIRRK